MTICKLEVVVSPLRGPLGPLRTRSSSKLAAILTKLSRARLTPKLISKRVSRLMFRALRRSRRTSNQNNSIGMKLLLINNGLSTVPSTFAVIRRPGMRVTSKTSSSFPSKDLVMVTSLPVSKMSLRRTLRNLTIF